MNRAGLARVALTACTAGLLWACSAGPAATAPSPAPQPAPAPAPPQPASARQALIDAIGTAACTSDAQCRTVAVGRKSCGGPQAYLPWSTQTTDAQRLQALADQYTEVQAAAEVGRMSTCSVVTDPGAACIQQRCGLRTGLPLK